MKVLQTTLKSSEDRQSALTKENIELKYVVQKLSLDLSKFTKGKENLDKLLRNQRFSNDKNGVGFEGNFSNKVKDEKSFSEKAQVAISGAET